MIQSMTGFSRVANKTKTGNITWEIRSINHRFLDSVFRLPEGLREIEPRLREILNAKIQRGRIECFLKFQPTTTNDQQISINFALVKSIAAAIHKVNSHVNSEKTAYINPFQLLSWDNVMQISSDYSSETIEKIIRQFERCVTQLVNDRKREGATLHKFVSERLQNITKLTKALHKYIPEILRNQRDNLEKRLKTISTELSRDRVEQEIILFAQKVDIAEEIGRLEAHVEAIKQALKGQKAPGKRLDFLMQELNREANTIASKSSSSQTSHVAVDLKVLIEQMREQIQNIE